MTFAFLFVSRVSVVAFKVVGNNGYVAPELADRRLTDARLRHGPLHVLQRLSSLSRIPSPGGYARGTHPQCGDGAVPRPRHGDRQNDLDRSGQPLSLLFLQG